MSLSFEPLPPVPADTARVAQAAFPNGNSYLRLRDEFGSLYRAQPLAGLFAPGGQAAISPVRLLLITVMQYAEGLDDRQTAEAVRSRIDWKYALSLPLEDAGFDASVLSGFRQRLVAGAAEDQFLSQMVSHFQAKGWLKAGGTQRTDATHVLAAIRTLNRLELVGETLRAALNALATVAPTWLLMHLGVEWQERYGPRFEQYRWPKQEPQRDALAVSIGHDGAFLLTAVGGATAPHWLRQIPAVEVLRRVWVQQYVVDDEQFRWRTSAELPPGAMLICSPYDEEARFSRKRETTWTGYKVHLTESCDPAGPHLITQVTTTPATTSDGSVLDEIQADLKAHALLPATHLVDGAYVDADTLHHSRVDYGLDLVGPAPQDTSWPAQAPERYDLTRFVIDWELTQVICPQGARAAFWMEDHDHQGHEVIRVRFRAEACAGCEARAQCCQGQAPRSLTFRARPQYEALHAARHRQTTPAFRATYAARAGIEGTLSQGTRAFGLRQARYIGLDKTRLQHLATAAAINLTRAIAFLEEVPRTLTRLSRFAALVAAPLPT